MSSGALPGFRDFFPTELAERAHIMRVWREVSRRYNFVEYDGPPLEPLDLYTKKAATRSSASSTPSLTKVAVTSRCGRR